MRRVAARLAVAVFAVVLVAGAVEAQTPEGGWDFGATAGVNFSTVSGSDAPDEAENLTGFMAGLSLIYGISDMLALQPELLYSRRGVKLSGSPSGEVRLGYIDVPVLLRIATGTGTQLRPVLFVGPYAGFQTSCNVRSGGQSMDCDDAELEVKTTDFGIIGGIGFDIQNWNLFVRFQQGLATLDDSSPADDIFNRVITVGARVSLRALMR